LFATGFLGIAFEMLVVRIAAEAMQDAIFTFAGLLAAYLLGTAFGALAWQGISRWFPAAAPDWPLAATALFGLVTSGLVPVIGELIQVSDENWLRGELIVACALFFLPASAMGATFVALGQISRDRVGSLGRAVGINGLGAALAPVATALVLIPVLGPWTALLVVSVLYLTLLPPRRRTIVLAAVPAAIAGPLWSRGVPSMVAVPSGGALLATIEGPAATASVVADASGARYLDVDGHFRMGGTNSVRSDWRQAMLPLLLHPVPHDALFLGVGTGTTLSGATRVPGVAVTGVELLPEVARLLPWFAEPDGPEMTARVIVADARRFIAADRNAHDVIFADLYHPALDGTGALYTVEHFAAAKTRLADGGLFCQWLPLFQLDQPSLRAIIRGFLDVFPEGSAWLAHFSVRTPMLALVGARTQLRIDLPRLAARLEDPRARDAFRRVGLKTPLDVVGLYLGGADSLRAFAGDGPRNTDDFPFVALDARANVRALTADPGVILIAVLHGLRPDAASILAGGESGDAERVMAFWRARDRFVETGTSLHGDPRGRALIEAASPGLLDAIRASPEFNGAYEPLLQMARGLAELDREAAVRLLRAIDAAAPSRPEARSLLARLVPK
jgi:spermidine synthase